MKVMLYNTTVKDVYIITALDSPLIYSFLRVFTLRFKDILIETHGHRN